MSIRNYICREPMVKEGDNIKLVSSPALEEMKLTALIGKTGIVSCVCAERKQPGAYIHLDAKYLGEYDWYLPLSAIQNKQIADNIKKQDIINQVFL